MFTELMSLIQSRPLTITVAAVNATEIRVNIVPQLTGRDKKANEQVGYSHAKDVAKIPDEAIQGLTTPLSLTGTPEAIDAELTNALTKFTSVHAELQVTFDDAAAAIKESVKAIEERERLKKEKSRASTTKAGGTEVNQNKQTEDSTLPLLFATQGESQPAAVSTGDTARASVPETAGADA